MTHSETKCLCCSSSTHSLPSSLAILTRVLQCSLLASLRVYWGWLFLMAGINKWSSLDSTVLFFQSIGIPFATFNVYLTLTAEIIGGICLILGLAARPAALILSFVMLVAYYTAHHTELFSLFTNPTLFINASPFHFLLTTLLVLAFGPGRLSLDYLKSKRHF